MNIQTNLIFISAFRKGQRDLLNLEAHTKLGTVLFSQGYRPTVVQGVYKGSKELSYLIANTDIAKHERALKLVLELAQAFEQESVLEVENDGTAVLHLAASGVRAEQGKFKQVTEAQALELGDFTREPQNNTYWAIV